MITIKARDFEETKYYALIAMWFFIYNIQAAAINHVFVP